MVWQTQHGLDIYLTEMVHRVTRVRCRLLVRCRGFRCPTAFARWRAGRDRRCSTPRVDQLHTLGGVLFGGQPLEQCRGGRPEVWVTVKLLKRERTTSGQQQGFTANSTLAMDTTGPAEG